MLLPFKANLPYLRKQFQCTMNLRKILFPTLAAVLWTFASCTKTTSQTGENIAADATSASTEQPLQQIPAAEVLGSTVKRNLRYQPEKESAEYLRLDSLLEYIRQIGLSLRRQIGKLEPETPCAGTVVVGLNAKEETHLWYVFPGRQPSAAFKAAALQAVAEVPKPKVNKRLVVFGVALTLWQYKESDADAAKVELPASWNAINNGAKAQLSATELAERTWNDPVQ